MNRFGKQLANIGRQSGMTADQTKALYRTVTSLGRAYGLTGKNAEKFVLESVAVGSAISKIGLDAQQILRQMNEVATGSEEGLIQSLLLGFKPSDPVGQLKAFQEQAKMITQMADQAGEQFAPFLTRRIGDKLGLKNFSVEQIQAMARGESVETNTGETIQKDMLDVLKGIRSTMNDQARANENPYATIGQYAQEGFTKLIAWFQEKLIPVLNNLKNKMAEWLPKLIPTLKNIKAKFDTFMEKFNSFFSMEGGPLKNFITGAALVSLATTLLPTLVGLVLKGLAGKLVGGSSAAGARGEIAARAGAGFLGGALGKMLPTANPAAAGAGAAAVASVAGLAAAALAFGGGVLIGTIIDKLWTGPNKDRMFDNIYQFIAGKKGSQEELDRKMAIGALQTQLNSLTDRKSVV